jgi:hypothetical protein
MATARVSRGRKSQQIATDYLKPVFPDAASIAASLPGKDILNTPGWAFEVKARRGFSPAEWLKQAKKNAAADVPVVIMRPDGYGEAKVADWITFLSLEDFRYMLIDLYRLNILTKELGEENARLLAQLSDRTNP